MPKTAKKSDTQIAKTPVKKGSTHRKCPSGKEYYNSAKRKRDNHRPPRKFFPGPLELDSKIEKPKSIPFKKLLDAAERKAASAKDGEDANVKSTVVSLN